jgi:hypothetical protein
MLVGSLKDDLIEKWAMKKYQYLGRQLNLVKMKHTIFCEQRSYLLATFLIWKITVGTIL